MVLVIILAFIGSTIASFVYYNILEKRERERLRLLAEIEIERAEKFRYEKLRSLENERQDLLVQRDLYLRLDSLNNINEYTTKSERDLKKSIAIHKNIASIDKKITQINTKIDDLNSLD